jgi:hypothetical protein
VAVRTRATSVQDGVVAGKAVPMGVAGVSSCHLDEQIYHLSIEAGSVCMKPLS